MRMIDADALHKKVKTECNPYGKPTINFEDGCKVLNMIDTAPTIETPHWIPCSERLPEVGQDVLFSVGGMYTAEGCLREDGDWAQFRWDATHKHDVVDAWQPLPEPYKEVTK